MKTKYSSKRACGIHKTDIVITKNRNTMFPSGIVKELNRKSFLEEENAILRHGLKSLIEDLPFYFPDDYTVDKFIEAWREEV